jgi:DNA-binding MarR family transcriptional regulator
MFSTDARKEKKSEAASAPAAAGAPSKASTKVPRKVASKIALKATSRELPRALPEAAAKSTKKRLAEPAQKTSSGASAGRVFQLSPTVSKQELLDRDGTSDRGFRQFLYDLSSLASYLGSARGYLAAQLGVTSPQYNIVMIVAQYQGASGVSITDVAQRLHVSTAFITSEIIKLESAGLVAKKRNPDDGRSVLLRVTAACEKRLQQIAAERLFVNDQLFRGLSGEDFRHLAATVASLIDDFAHTVDILETTQRGRAARAAKNSG